MCAFVFCFCNRQDTCDRRWTGGLTPHQILRCKILHLILKSAPTVQSDPRGPKWLQNTQNRFQIKGFEPSNSYEQHGVSVVVAASKGIKTTILGLMCKILHPILVCKILHPKPKMYYSYVERKITSHPLKMAVEFFEKSSKNRYQLCLALTTKLFRHLKPSATTVTPAR